MGFIDSFKRAASGLASLVGLGTKPTADGKTDAMVRNVDVAGDPTYRRTTTAIRRFNRDANREYNHVSMEVDHNDWHIVDVMGYSWWRNRYRDGHLRGTTYNVGIKAEKRRLKGLGLNKRQLRAALRVFRAQLVAQGVK